MSLRRTEHIILFIEANLDAREFIREAFAKADGSARVEFVSTPEAGFAVIGRETVDALFVNAAQSGLSVHQFVRDLAAINRQATNHLDVAQYR